MYGSGKKIRSRSTEPPPRENCTQHPSLSTLFEVLGLSRLVPQKAGRDSPHCNLTVNRARPDRAGCNNHRSPRSQVPECARRRLHNAKCKSDILADHDSVDREGRGALLRREAPYTSLVSAWRDHATTPPRHHAITCALAAPARPLGARPASRSVRDVARLRIGNARLERELESARQVISIQGKLSALLGQLPTNSSIPDNEK